MAVLRSDIPSQFGERIRIELTWADYPDKFEEPVGHDWQKGLGAARIPDVRYARVFKGRSYQT
ncbi:hypothetical protein IMCC26134_12340 [Verrucomicrobia bacterium IMCC26134]|nr:hypothetical protein IMCC26134_12340 [Verrucomicrobia bacterium IMCC26134]